MVHWFESAEPHGGWGLVIGQVSAPRGRGGAGGGGAAAHCCTQLDDDVQCVDFDMNVIHDGCNIIVSFQNMCTKITHFAKQ